jgi:O-antigen/teichoic acid export membrane protein
MARSASGLVLSYGLAVVLPYLARVKIGPRDYAMWALLASVATVATSLDLGGVSMLAAWLPDKRQDQRRVYVTGLLLTLAGTLASTAAFLGLWMVLCAFHNNPVPSSTGLLAIAAMGGGALVRSVVTTDATLAMATEDYRVQSRLYSTQAIAQTVVALALLGLGFGYWALPVAVLVSSSGVVVGAARYRSRLLSRRADVTPGPLPSVRRFATARMAGSLMLLAVTQGDRWVVALAAGPSLLASYDLVTRTAAIPKFMAAALTSVVTPQRVRLATLDGATQLYQRAQTVVFGAVGAGTVVILGVVLLASWMGHFSGWIVGLLALFLFAHGLHSLSFVGAMFLAAQNEPERELPAIFAGFAGFVAMCVCAVTVPHGTEVAVLACPVALIVKAAILLRSRPWHHDPLPEISS